MPQQEAVCHRCSHKVSQHREWSNKDIGHAPPRTCPDCYGCDARTSADEL